MGYSCSVTDSTTDGDLNNLVSDSGSSPTRIHSALKNIRGLGDVGIDILFDTAQSLWTCLSPFIDLRSAKAAERIRLGCDVNTLWEDVGRDPKEICRLVAALTTTRLEKNEKGFE